MLEDLANKTGNAQCSSSPFIKFILIAIFRADDDAIEDPSELALFRPAPVNIKINEKYKRFVAFLKLT